MTASQNTQNIEVLNSETHRNLKIKPLKDLEFAEKWSNTQILPGEFPQVAKQLPIVFAKNRSGGIDAVAILCVKENQNLMIQNGKWAANYMPATLRQYPFILARTDEKKDEFVLCFDKSAPCIGEKIKGERLFTETGEQTDTAKDLLNFIQEVQKESVRSEVMTQKLTDFDLLKDVDAKFNLPDGEEVTFKGMRIIDEEKLKNLEPEKLAELNKSGILYLIYLHILSLSNLGFLVQMYANQKTAASA